MDASNIMQNFFPAEIPCILTSGYSTGFVIYLPILYIAMYIHVNQISCIGIFEQLYQFYT